VSVDFKVNEALKTIIPDSQVYDLHATSDSFFALSPSAIYLIRHYQPVLQLATFNQDYLFTSMINLGSNLYLLAETGGSVFDINLDCHQPSNSMPLTLIGKVEADLTNLVPLVDDKYLALSKSWTSVVI